MFNAVIKLLNEYGILIMLNGTTLNKKNKQDILYHLRKRIPVKDSELNLLLSYDFDDNDDFINRIQISLPNMRTKGLI